MIGIKTLLKKLISSVKWVPFILLCLFVMFWIIAITVIVVPLTGSLPVDNNNIVASNWAAAVAGLLLMVLSCRLVASRWCNGEITLGNYRIGENCIFAIRLMVIALAICFAVIVFNDNSEKDTDLYCTGVLMAVAFGISVLQLVFRTTFRQVPGWLIAIGCAILYVAFLTIPFDESKAQIFGGMTTAETVGNLQIEKLLSIAGIAFFVEIVKEIVQEFLLGVQKKETDNVFQNKREIRKKLLTHWRYNKDGSVSDFADLVIVLGFVLIVLLIIVGFRVYMLQDTKQALSSYLFIVAGTLILIGLAAHSNISESSMIRSEYQYLVTYGAKIKQSDIEQPSTHWRDYCQVLVNLCVNVSGVHSEDKGYHTIYEMLQRMWDALPDGSCAKQKFLIDIVQVKYDAYARVLRDAIVDHDADSQANDVRRAQDLQFAANFKNLFYSCSDIQYPKDIMEFSVPELITLMNEAFFSGNKKDVWNQRFSPFNITAEDGIALMKLDALQVIMKRYGKGDCGFTLLGCRCNNSSNCSQSRENDNIIDVAVRRLELVVVYPLILVESFKKRWNPGFDDALFGEDFRLYYGTHLIGDEHSLVDNNELCVICKKVTLQNFEETDKQDILYKVLKSAVFSFAASKVDSVVLTD